MNTNSENPKVGKDFENIVSKWAKKQFKSNFCEKAIGIGNPAKPHKFDLVSEDNAVIIECKCYTWTIGNNVPSAKMAVLDEAAFYLLNVKYPVKRIIAMKKDYNDKKKQTLADYFCEKKGHLLEDIAVVEIDDKNKIRIVRGYI